MEMKGKSGRLPGSGSLRLVSASVVGLSALNIVGSDAVCGSDVLGTNGSVGSDLFGGDVTDGGEGAVAVAEAEAARCCWDVTAGGALMSGDSENGSGGGREDEAAGETLSRDAGAGGWNEDALSELEAALVLGVGGGSCAALGGSSTNTTTSVKADSRLRHTWRVFLSC